jgi:hypothetical protein
MMHPRCARLARDSGNAGRAIRFGDARTRAAITRIGAERQDAPPTGDRRPAPVAMARVMPLLFFI